MLLGVSLVWVASMAVLTTCLPGAPPTPTGEEPDSSWLPYLPWASNTALSLPATHTLQDAAIRTKRVFLSRGWGPGGYDAPPPPPPQRYTRQPLVPTSHVQDDTDRPVPSSLALKERAGQARFAALVSTQRQETQPQPQYRRFHSIFTSGTWSPLGKRSATMREPGVFLGMKAQGGSDKLAPLFTKAKPFVKDKRAGVFASQGWGAGGSPTPTWSSASSSSSSSSTSWTNTRHPWLAAPLISSENTSGSGGGGGERYVASFRSGGPLLHHFLSHGWRPMGR